MKVDVIVLIVVLVLLLLRQLVTTSVSTAEVAGAPRATLRVAEALLALPLAVKMDFASFENKDGRETTVKKLIGREGKGQEER